MPTATLDVLCVFFMLSLERRRVLHVNVTAHPYAAWAARQMIEAVAPDVVTERVIGDRDGIFGAVFDKRLAGMGLEQFRIAPRAPWQSTATPTPATEPPAPAKTKYEELVEVLVDGLFEIMMTERPHCPDRTRRRRGRGGRGEIP